MTAQPSILSLAIFGGAPAFREKLHVGRPNIGNRNRLYRRLDDILDRGWLTNNGIYVQELEKKIETLTGVKHCIAICNGTVALEIAIKALGLSGEVIVPSFTFVATAHALQWHNLTPVFCDLDPDTHNLDPQALEQLITPRTTGIIGVHIWGRPCDINAISQIADRHHLKVLYDAAHAFSCSYHGRMIGNFGDAEVFSFHATKFFNTIEGGAILTNDDALAKQARLYRNFGFIDYDTVVDEGTNGKMNEFSAAMGLTLMESLGEILEVNYANYRAYQEGLEGIPGIRMAAYDETQMSNYQYIILEIDEFILGINRDQVLEILHAENIFARRYFYPGCHQMEPYRTLDPDAGQHLPYTEQLTSRVMSLPTGTAVKEKDIRTICDIIRSVAASGPELAGLLQKQA